MLSLRHAFVTAYHGLVRALSIALVLSTAAPSFGDEQPLLPASDEGPVHSTASPARRLTVAAFILDTAATGLLAGMVAALVAYQASGYAPGMPLNGAHRSGDALAPVELGALALLVLAGGIALHIMAAHTSP